MINLQSAKQRPLPDHESNGLPSGRNAAISCSGDTDVCTDGSAEDGSRFLVRVSRRQLWRFWRDYAALWCHSAEEE